MIQEKPAAKRRVVSGSDSIHKAIEEARNRPVNAMPAPQNRRELSELARIERQLHLADLALNQYQMKLEQGSLLDTEEQRLFLAHQDSIRKLEMSRAALMAKSDLSKKSDLDVARKMIEKGMPHEYVLNLFAGNTEVEEGLRGDH